MFKLLKKKNYIFIFFFILSFVIILLYYNYQTDIQKVDTHKIINNEIIEKVFLDMSHANRHYISQAVFDIGSNDFQDSYNLFLRYNCISEVYKKNKCWIFEIDDTDLKLYAFPYSDRNLQDTISQTVFVDETALLKDDVFLIGDNLDKVKSIYSNIQLVENNFLIGHGDKYYFEILNESGLYSYGIDNNGYIVSIKKYDFKSSDMKQIDINADWYDEKIQEYE